MPSLACPKPTKKVGTFGDVYRVWRFGTVEVVYSTTIDGVAIQPQFKVFVGGRTGRVVSRHRRKKAALRVAMRLAKGGAQ